MDDLTILKRQVGEDVENSENIEELERVTIKYLGRKGLVTGQLRSLKNLPLEERRRIGPQANALRRDLEEMIGRRRGQLLIAASERPFIFDATKPGGKMRAGSLHPLSKVEEAIRSIFTSMSFSVVEGPELECEYYNFDALNMPENHPARDMWDTFWLKPPAGGRLSALSDARGGPGSGGKLLMRTHTSPVQVRYMETHQPPFQIIVPGRVFRYEALDASHEFNFYQVEGLMVGKDVTLANFKFVVETFLKKLFGEKVEFRFRPSYFPFVEPGIEVDVRLKGSWLEMMGAGMVHARVFDAVRYNPNEAQGFAFGMGLERLAMILYDIPDIRLFYSGDVRFARQF